MEKLIKIVARSNSKTVSSSAATYQNEDLNIETNSFNKKLNCFDDLDFMTLTQRFYRHLGVIHFMSPELIKYKPAHNLYALFENSEVGYYLKIVEIFSKIESLKKEVSSENIDFSPDEPNLANFHAVMGIKYFEAKMNKFLHMNSLEEIYARKLWPYVIGDSFSIQLACEEGTKELSEEYLYKISTFLDSNIASPSALTRIKIHVLKDSLKTNIMTFTVQSEVRNELSKLESIVLPLEDE